MMSHVKPLAFIARFLPVLGHRADGFTLIEVMMGIVLTAILVLGLMALWTMIAANLQDLTIRQKAIIVMNGELERLAAIYQSDPSKISNNSQLVQIAGDGQRQIYANTIRTAFPAGIFLAASNALFVPGEVLYHDRGNGVGADDRNLVWLDRTRSFVGAISWKLEGLDVASPTLPSYPIGGNYVFQSVTQAAYCEGGPCQFVVFYIRFPYRFDASTGGLTPSDAADEDRLAEIDVHTIFGRRQ